jgi:transcriptional regulator with XRE-family HTH domain
VRLSERFRNRLKLARQMRGWTAAEAAERCGFSRDTWHSWEQGRRQPRFENVERVAKRLGVRVLDLLR